MIEDTVKSRPFTMICLEEHTIGYYISHILILALIFLVAWLINIFSMKRHLFPVKERAPVLALTQSIYFLLLVICPYLVEVFVLLGIDWRAEVWTNIPFLRKFLKALYLSLRFTAYPLFLLRYNFLN